MGWNSEVRSSSTNPSEAGVLDVSHYFLLGRGGSYRGLRPIKTLTEANGNVCPGERCTAWVKGAEGLGAGLARLGM